MLIYHPTLKCFDWCAADIFARIIFLFLFPIDIGTFASFLQKKHDEYWIGPPPHFQKGKEKDRLHLRFFLQIGIKSEIILPFETIMFYMDVVDQIFKNAFTNRNCKHHFDVQWWSSSLLYPSLWLFEMMLRLLINTKSQCNDRYKVSYSREVCGSGSGVGV